MHVLVLALNPTGKVPCSGQVEVTKLAIWCSSMILFHGFPLFLRILTLNDLFAHFVTSICPFAS